MKRTSYVIQRVGDGKFLGQSRFSYGSRTQTPFTDFEFARIYTRIQDTKGKIRNGVCNGHAVIVVPVEITLGEIK